MAETREVSNQPIKQDIPNSLTWPKAYGCVKCQTYHYEDENLYASHLTYQSKHGIQRRDPQFRDNV